ncbi:MAG: GC-type dockerin domain-anchored protein [Phycisphaerales bacterium JB039]
MALRLLILIVLVVLAACGPAPGQCEPALRGFTGGNAYDAEILGNLVFVANGWGGLLVVEASDVSGPREVARLNLPGSATGIAIAVRVGGERVAYIAASTPGGDPGGGTYVVDVADATRPRLIATVGAPQPAYDALISGERLYLCEGEAGLAIYSVSNPHAPAPLGRAPTAGSARSVTVVDHLAYIAAFDGGLEIFDVSDAAEPKLLATVIEPQRARSVVVNNGYAYVSAAGPQSPGDDAAIWTIDVSNPTRPLVVDDFYVRYPYGLEVAGDRLYFANHIFGLKVYSLTEPAHPALLGEIDLENAYSVRVADHTAYVSDGWTGLVTVDVHDPSRPTVLGEYRQIDTGMIRVFAHEDVAYMDRMEVVDISDPGRPLLTHEPEIELRDLHIEGTIAVAATRTGLMMLDLTDPTQPASLGGGAGSALGFPLGVALADDVAFLCGPDYGFEFQSFLRAFDVSDPRTPRLLDELIIFPGGGYDVEARGEMVYLANGRLMIYDASNPADLELLYAESGRFVDVVLRNDLLYALGRSLRIYDIEVPAAPVLLGEIGVTGRNIVLDWPLAYVSGEEDGVLVVDVGNPADPDLVATVATPDRALFVAISGDRLCVAAYTEALQIYDISSCGCRPDLDGDGALTLFDFLEFQNLFAFGDLRADFDGDGELTLFDFLAFQDVFAAGC